MDRLSEARIAEMAEKLAGCDYPWVEAVADVRALLQDRVLLRGERDEARQQREDARLRANRTTRVFEPSMDGYRGAVATYEAAFGKEPLIDDALKVAEQTIATLTAEVYAARIEHTRAIIRSTLKGYTAGENTDSKAWRKRAEAAEQRVGTLTVELDEQRDDADYWAMVADGVKHSHRCPNNALCSAENAEHCRPCDRCRAEAAESALKTLQGACEQLLKQHAPRFVLGDPLIEGLNVLLTTPPVPSEPTKVSEWCDPEYER